MTADRAVALADLLDVLPEDARLLPAPAGATEASTVWDVTHDSREAGPGVLFACRPGARMDGHNFAPAAIAAGSPALLCERVLDVAVPQLVTRDVARVLGPVAARVQGDPSAALTLLGVTGTNGKTTTTFLLESALRAGGHVTGMVGTIRTLVAGTAVEGVRTTPESTDLQRLLARMVDAGVTAAAMEVSSHGLALHRVDGTRFAAVAFTNLSQDHLDFHADLADYEAAKTRLFDERFAPIAVVDVDDPAGLRVAAAARAGGQRVVRVSPSGSPEAEVVAQDVAAGPEGSAFTAVLHGDALPVTLRLPGHFNVANALIALVLADAAGVDGRAAAAGIGDLDGVPGRMERIEVGQPFTVLVDYAHKPVALESVLMACRQLTQGRVLLVVGCGGDRDAGKRPLMGAVAARLADLAVLTSDNPRTEDPQAILDTMLVGARSVPGAHVVVEPDRAHAIALVLAAARPGDVVILAGKGHERYQELADRRAAFDDLEVARDLLAGGAG